MRLKVSSVKWRPFCLGLNVLNQVYSYSCLRQCVSIRTSEWHAYLNKVPKRHPVISYQHGDLWLVAKQY